MSWQRRANQHQNKTHWSAAEHKSQEGKRLRKKRRKKTKRGFELEERKSCHSFLDGEQPILKRETITIFIDQQRERNEKTERKEEK